MNFYLLVCPVKCLVDVSGAGKPFIDGVLQEKQPGVGSRGGTKAAVAESVGEFHLGDFAINLETLVHISMQMIIVM